MTRLFRCEKQRVRVILFFLIGLLAFSAGWSDPGQSAVITLVFPPGARATGLGEAFTGLANDANTTYFNPAGLGQDPLANSWKSFLERKGPFAAVAAKHKTSIVSSEVVWVGTGAGVQRYSGKAWESHEIYLVEQGDDLRIIARKYISAEDPGLLDDAVWKIREANGIEMKRYSTISAKLGPRLKDSLLAPARSSCRALARGIIDMPKQERSAAKIYGLLSGFTDSLTADTLSDEIADILAKNDVELSDFVELKIPFTIAISDSVTAIAMDESERLWVGTPGGLWRMSESKWNRTTVADGLPSNRITCIAVGSYGDLAVGTDAGLGIYKDGRWMKYGTADGLPDQHITAAAFGQNRLLYAGCAKGLIRKNDSSLTLFDTANGLLSKQVHSLLSDSKNRLWIGGDNGITILSGNTWKRYKFPGSSVRCFAEQRNGSIWIGTSKGAINYTETSGKGSHPEWKAYHSKNVLVGDDVLSMTTWGDDVWIATDQALNKYQWAQKQALMFWEPLLPAFHLTELWHTYFSFIYPTEDWGTLGASINFINMGRNTWTDELGRQLGDARSWEGVFGLSYGLPLNQTLSFGLNIKYVNSALAPGIQSGAGVGTTYAIDAAVLKRNFFTRNLSVGFMFQNMGPSIYYAGPENTDPIPFTLRLGAAYTALQTPIHEITLLLDMDREVVKKNESTHQPDPFWKALWTDLINNKEHSLIYQLQEVNYHIGVEYWYSHFMALRMGFLEDYIGERYELTFGLGLNYGNMNFDWSYIYSPEGFLKPLLEKLNPAKVGSTGARHGQYRVSFLFRL